MDGAELARRVRGRHPSTAVLLITGYTGKTDAASDLARLPKPFSLAELAIALHEVHVRAKAERMTSVDETLNVGL